MKTAERPEYLKVRDVARRLGLGESTVYEMCALGVLPSVKLGRSVRVPAAELAEWLRGRRGGKADKAW